METTVDKVCIMHQCEAAYPSADCWFCPSEKYPEYRYDTISQSRNEVYDMVRSALYLYGLDRDNFGSPLWNPFGNLIKCGDTVVIKPNWVEAANPSKHGDLECLVTNSSVIRAVLDYVLIALNGTGKIYIADSPMPDCDIKALFRKAHVESLIEWCKLNHLNVEFADIRSDIVTGFGKNVVSSSGDNDVFVDIGADSYFKNCTEKSGRFRNGFVDAREMNEVFHHDNTHVYGISKLMLQADVILNLPKPKTHRKAGFTGALKNFIGTCSIKRSIPHNVTGNTKSGGDEYNGPSIVYGTETKLRDIENRMQYDNHPIIGAGIKILRTPFFLYRRLMHKKYQGLGNWSGNDTIWRSILDINRILLYASKDGTICETPQRRFFTLGDMIVSGQHNGPLEPDSKQMGIIICSDNPVAFDNCLCKLMGFAENCLPLLRCVNSIDSYQIPFNGAGKLILISNETYLNNKRLCEVTMPKQWRFIPADGWDIAMVDVNVPYMPDC